MTWSDLFFFAGLLTFFLPLMLASVFTHVEWYRQWLSDHMLRLSSAVYAGASILILIAYVLMLVNV